MTQARKQKPVLLGQENGMDIWKLPSGDTFTRAIGQGPGKSWDELDYETQLNDLRSLAKWGQKGTSVGDAWPQHLIDAAKGIVGSSDDVTKEHIEKFISHMRDTGSMSYMSPHPGTEAYTPEFIQQNMESLWKIMGMSKGGFPGGRF